MVRGSSGIAEVSRILPTDHRLTCIDLTGSLNFFKFIQVYLFVLLVLSESEAAILRFRPAKVVWVVCVSECGGPTLSYFSISEQYCV